MINILMNQKQGLTDCDQKDSKILPLSRESKPKMPYLKTRCYGFPLLIYCQCYV